MSNRKSQLTAKAYACNKREFTIYCRDRRDDGELRRSAREPLTVQQVRDASRERKVRIGTINKCRLEISRRVRLNPEQLEERIALVGELPRRPLNEVISPDAAKPRFYGKGKRRVRIARTFRY